MNFTKLQASHVIQASADSSLDGACYLLQETIGQKAGDNAGMFFSHTSSVGPNERNWPRANQAMRQLWLVDYLHCECGDIEDEDLEEAAHKVVSLIGEAVALLHKATGQVPHVAPQVDNFTSIRTRDGDDYSMPTVRYGTATVRALVDDEENYPFDAVRLEEFGQKYGSDLLNDVPNIEVRIGDATVVYLTWNEAHNLGKSLQDVARVCLFG